MKQCRAAASAGSRSALPDLTDRLRRKSARVTGARRAILEVLRRQTHPMAIHEIYSALDRHCDLATVYRSIHLLEKTAMVKRFDLGDGRARFELLIEGDDGHHHHLVCTRCAGVIEVGECSMHALEEKIAARNGFKAVTHKLEFFGICPECQ